MFVGGLYGERGAGGARCPAALFNWWTDGDTASGNPSLPGPVPDNYIVVDTSSSGATASIESGGSMGSWTDAWQGSGRPQFFFFDPGLNLVNHLTASDLGYNYALLASRTAPIVESMVASWTGCIAGDSFCTDLIPAGGAQDCVDQPPSVIVNLAWHSSLADCSAVESVGYCTPDIPGSTSLDAGTRALVEENCPLTCGFCEPSAPCGDVTMDGIVDVNDLLLVLSQYGQSEILVADANFDNAIDVNDLLLVLSQFGEVC